jgi:hypothetical protein
MRGCVPWGACHVSDKSFLGVQGSTPSGSSRAVGRVAQRSGSIPNAMNSSPNKIQTAPATPWELPEPETYQGSSLPLVPGKPTKIQPQVLLLLFRPISERFPMSEVSATAA